MTRPESVLAKPGSGTGGVFSQSSATRVRYWKRPARAGDTQLERKLDVHQFAFPLARSAITDVVDAVLSAVASVGVSTEVVVASPVFVALELRHPCQPTLEAEGSAVQVGLASDQNNRTSLTMSALSNSF